MHTIKPWIEAARPRTLPLALASIGMGAFLAASVQQFRVSVFLLSALTTIFLQILSNLANDYGDSIHGADSADREGPARAVQSGAISARAMKKSIIIFGLLSLLSGIVLLWVAFQDNLPGLLFFLGIGILAIIAAITYTSGAKPYGYAGLGDISVLIFFGIVGVMGSFYLHTHSFSWKYLLPALSCGLFSMAVLNVNNIRDIKTDKMAGKKSIPVRLGRKKAVVYHWLLLTVGVLCSLIYISIDFRSFYQYLFLLAVPLLVVNGMAVYNKHKPSELDPYLKQMALTTMVYVLAFGIGNLL